MKLIEAKQFVISRLRGLPVCDPNSSMTQWVVRCPYCPDSLTPTHGHFSIKIDEHSDELMLYRCLKCNESGLLSSQTLDDLGIYLTQEEAAELDRANRGGKSNYWNEKPKNYFIPPPISPVNLELKLQYLESRFGFRMTDQMIQESKVVLSIIDFLSANKIPLGQFSPYIIKSLENHYIGFLSSDKNQTYFDLPEIFQKDPRFFGTIRWYWMREIYLRIHFIPFNVQVFLCSMMERCIYISQKGPSISLVHIIT